jgi:hypothetical protein
LVIKKKNIINNQSKNRFRLELMRKLYNNVDMPTPTSILQFDNYTTHIIFANDNDYNSLDDSHSDHDSSLAAVDSSKRDKKKSSGGGGGASLSNKQKKLIKKSKELLQSYNYHVNNVEISHHERYFFYRSNKILLYSVYSVIFCFKSVHVHCATTTKKLFICILCGVKCYL